MDFYERYLEDNLKDPEFEKAWNDTELEYIIARNIIRRRRSLGLSQHDIAARMRTRQSVISRIESGQQNMTLKSLKLLADILQTNVPDLMNSDEDQEDTSSKKFKLVKN